MPQAANTGAHPNPPHPAVLPPSCSQQRVPLAGYHWPTVAELHSFVTLHRRCTRRHRAPQPARHNRRSHVISQNEPRNDGWTRRSPPSPPPPLALNHCQYIPLSTTQQYCGAPQQVLQRTTAALRRITAVLQRTTAVLQRTTAVLQQRHLHFHTWADRQTRHTWTSAPTQQKEGKPKHTAIQGLNS
jgi:hypothetical protein